jgi:hypothetical protein
MRRCRQGTLADSFNTISPNFRGLVGEIGWIPVPGITMTSIGSTTRMMLLCVKAQPWRASPSPP